MKNKYNFKYISKDNISKSVEIEANDKFVEQFNLGGCYKFHCDCCPLDGDTCKDLNSITTHEMFRYCQLEPTIEKENTNMRTKEIEVYIKEKDFQESNNGENHLTSVSYYLKSELKTHLKYLKAKIIIEIPEKTVTITEGQFNKAYDVFLEDCPFPRVSELKKALGF